MYLLQLDIVIKLGFAGHRPEPEPVTVTIGMDGEPQDQKMPGVAQLGQQH